VGKSDGSKKRAEIDEVGFPSPNIARYVTLQKERHSSAGSTFVITGEKGQKTAISGHGVKHGDYYFEIEVLDALKPLPFVGVNPALRVGFTTFDEQNLELPLGTSQRSYAYASTGRMITKEKFSKSNNNTQYGKIASLQTGHVS
jgi:hypothetical protein